MTPSRAANAMKLATSMLLIRAFAAICHAETGDSVADDLDNFNTLREPAKLASSASFSIEYFDRDQIHSNAALKLELGKAFGNRQQWVTFLSGEVSVANRGPNDFAVKCGLSYVFK